MIDVFNFIYTNLKEQLDAIDIPITTGYQQKHNMFPIVVLDEVSNITDLNTLDTEGVYADNVSLEINIYSNSKTPRTEITPIKQLIDEYLTKELACNRNFASQTPNYDVNVFRYTMRYNFIIDKNLTIYRR